MTSNIWCWSNIIKSILLSLDFHQTTQLLFLNNQHLPGRNATQFYDKEGGVKILKTECSTDHFLVSIRV